MALPKGTRTMQQVMDVMGKMSWHRSFFVLICLVMIQHEQLLFAQHPSSMAVIDSLNRELQRPLHDTVRLATLSTLTVALNRVSLYDSAIGIAAQTQALARKVNRPHVLAASLHEQAIALYSQGEFKESIKRLDHAKQIYLSIDDLKAKRGIAGLAMTYGQIFTNQAEYDRALEVYYDALTLRESLNDTFAIGGLSNNLGLVFEKLEKYEEALIAYRKAEKVARQYNAQIPLATTLNNIGIIYERLNRFQDAVGVYQEALAIKEKTGNKRSISITQSNLANVFRRVNQLDVSLTYELKAIALQKEIGDQRSLAISYRSIAETYLKLGQLTKALSYSHQSREITEHIGLREELPKSYLNLYDITHALEMKDSSAYWINRYIAVRDSIFNESLIKRTEELKARYETEKKEFEIASLKRESEVIKEVSEKERLFFILASIGFICFIGFIGFSARQNQKLAEKLKAQNQTLEALLEELKNANQLKVNLLSIASHDLKNPIQTISGFSHLIAQSSEATDQIRTMSIHIQNASERMNLLILDLIDTAALQQGQFTVSLSDVSLSDIVAQSVTSLQPLATAKSQELILTKSDNVSIKGHDMRLSQVFENIISNAIKYTPHHGKIWITVETYKKNGKERAAISVKDNGQGMSDEDLKSVFTPFNRLSSKPTGGESSTGLGLYIVKHFIELMNGQISFRSDGKGKGTECIVEFDTSIRP